MFQFWMIDDLYKCIQSNMTFANHFMSVFSRSQFIFRVIDMNGFEFLKSDNTIKFVKYPIKVVDDIISCIKDMASIQANTNFIFNAYAINNLSQLFKTSSNLCPFTCHGF